ncbi:uncharacterized protein [Pseudorasbora parva]|uniref:uncharacterized protein n=1 Tax=Pseudorasbora parva TaxID=51549 RepID=UPI00351F07E4
MKKKKKKKKRRTQRKRQAAPRLTRNRNATLAGVSNSETDETEFESVSAMEGSSVILRTDLTEIQNDDTILWLFGAKDFLIFHLIRKHDLTSVFLTDDKRFRDRLQVDQKTGSLTIRNTRVRHSGQYKLSISRQKTTTKIFKVTVIGVVGEMDGVMSVSVTEGESVTLQTDVEVQRDDLIVWRFGDKGILLAKIDVESNETSLNDDDERFRDRLKLDQTGSLTIRNTKTEHSGLYEVQIRGRESSQQFLLSVTAVPDPGLSPGIAVIIAVVALLLAVVVPCVVIYYRRKISELEKKGETTEVSATDGNSVTLKTNTKIEKDDTVKWWYQDKKNHPIAEINGGIKRTHDGFDHRFRSKLELPDDDSGKNHQKGDLIIVKERSVNEGDRVPLKIQTDPEIQPDDLILWTFGTENRLIVKADSRTTDIGERFRGRVELDKTTGSLTITNIRTEDKGHFKLQIINSKETTFKRFNVSVNGE